MSKDYLDNLIAAEDDADELAPGERRPVMVTMARAQSSAEIDEVEREFIAYGTPWIVWWADYENGEIEPLTPEQIAVLAKMGITPEEYEIAVLEDRLEHQQKGTRHE